LSTPPVDEDDAFNVIVQMDIDSVYFQQQSFQNLVAMLGENWAFKTWSLKDRYNDGMRGTRIAFDCTQMAPGTKPMAGGYPANVFRLDRLPSIRVADCSIPGLPGYTAVIFLSLIHCPRLRISGLMTTTEIGIVNTILNYAVHSAKEENLFPRILGMLPKFRLKSSNTIVTANFVNSNHSMPFEVMRALAQKIDQSISTLSAMTTENLLTTIKSETWNGTRIQKVYFGTDRASSVLGSDEDIIRSFAMFSKGLLWTFSLAGVKNHFKTNKDFTLHLPRESLLDGSAQRKTELFVKTTMSDLKKMLIEQIFPRYVRVGNDDTIDMDNNQRPKVLSERDERGIFHFDIGLDFLPSNPNVDLFLCSSDLSREFRKSLNQKRTDVSAYMEGAEVVSILFLLNFSNRLSLSLSSHHFFLQTQIRRRDPHRRREDIVDDSELSQTAVELARSAREANSDRNRLDSSDESSDSFSMVSLSSQREYARSPASGDIAYFILLYMLTAKCYRQSKQQRRAANIGERRHRRDRHDTTRDQRRCGDRDDDRTTGRGNFDAPTTFRWKR
jgi:hypothetical protein